MLPMLWERTRGAEPSIVSCIGFRCLEVRANSSECALGRPIGRNWPGNLEFLPESGNG